MSKLYKAILHGDRLEWIDAPPAHGAAVPVNVVVTSPRNTANGDGMADALERLARSGGIAAIEDPVAWQRELRKDRPLPRAGA